MTTPLIAAAFVSTILAPIKLHMRDIADNLLLPVLVDVVATYAVKCKTVVAILPALILIEDTKSISYMCDNFSYAHDGFDMSLNTIADCCSQGLFHVVELYITRFNVTLADIHSMGDDDEDERLLPRLCLKGALNAAKWVTARFGYSRADLCGPDRMALALACRFGGFGGYGNFETAQWLVSAFSLTEADVRIQLSAGGHTLSDYPATAAWLNTAFGSVA